MLTATLSPASHDTTPETALERRFDARPATRTDTLEHTRPQPSPVVTAAPVERARAEVPVGRWRRMLQRLTSTHEPVPPLDGPLSLRDVRDAQVRDLGYHARLL